MKLVVDTIKNKIITLERFRDNHKKNNDQKNVDYLQRLINEHLKVIDILSVIDSFPIDELKKVKCSKCGTDMYNNFTSEWHDSVNCDKPKKAFIRHSEA